MLKFNNVSYSINSEARLDSFTFSFKDKGFYYVQTSGEIIDIFIKLISRQVIEDSGDITYEDIKLNQYHTLNRDYEDLVFINGLQYINKLSVIDNYLCELFYFYHRRDVALDVVATYLDKIPSYIDVDKQYGSYNKSTQSLIELFAVNFFDYSIVLLNKPFDFDEKINFDYLKMIDTLRENKLVIYFGSNNTLNDTELLGGYKDKYIRIDEIGEVFDDED